VHRYRHGPLCLENKTTGMSHPSLGPLDTKAPQAQGPAPVLYKTRSLGYLAETLDI